MTNTATAFCLLTWLPAYLSLDLIKNTPVLPSRFHAPIGASISNLGAPHLKAGIEATIMMRAVAGSQDHRVKQSMKHEEFMST